MTILFLMGLVTVRQSTYWRSSIDLWSRAVEVQPDNPWVRQKLAYSLWKEGRPHEGLNEARRATSLAPHWLEGWETLGQVALAAGEPVKAEGAFRQQLGLAPNAVTAYLGLARSREAQGDARTAFDAYLKALTLKRDYREAAENIVHLAIRNKWEEEALEALPSNPTSIWIELGRGDLLWNLGRSEEARGMWRRILLSRPDFEPAVARLERPDPGLGESAR
jgi:tetratricopeptide (TPR) repeat protein